LKSGEIQRAPSTHEPALLQASRMPSPLMEILLNPSLLVSVLTLLPATEAIRTGGWRWVFRDFQPLSLIAMER
jgi:hypothetical protein